MPSSRPCRTFNSQDNYLASQATMTFRDDPLPERSRLGYLGGHWKEYPKRSTVRPVIGHEYQLRQMRHKQQFLCERADGQVRCHPQLASCWWYTCTRLGHDRAIKEANRNAQDHHLSRRSRLREPFQTIGCGIRG